MSIRDVSSHWTFEWKHKSQVDHLRLPLVEVGNLASREKQIRVFHNEIVQGEFAFPFRWDLFCTVVSRQLPRRDPCRGPQRSIATQEEFRCPELAALFVGVMKTAVD
jgi:hypothetical protein